MKSRGHSLSALPRSGSSEPTGDLASRRQRLSRRRHSARTSEGPAGGGSPPPGLGPLSPPPRRRGGGRPAASARARPSSATGAREAELKSLALLSPPPSFLYCRRGSFGRRKALQKFAPGLRGHLSPVLLARKVLCRCGGSPDSSGRQLSLSALSAAPEQQALLLGRR